MTLHLDYHGCPCVVFFMDLIVASPNLLQLLMWAS